MRESLCWIQEYGDRSSLEMVCTSTREKWNKRDRLPTEREDLTQNEDEMIGNILLDNCSGANRDGYCRQQNVVGR